MNIIKIMTPKIKVEYLLDSDTLAEGLSKMKSHGYTSVPVVSEDSKCVGTLSEGDCLWYIMNHRDAFCVGTFENVRIADVMNKTRNPAVRIDVSDETLFSRITGCNFVPVTDDRDCFVGIVTRRAVLNYFQELVSGTDHES